MKIKLESQSGVSVLKVSGAVAAPELEVLKAGISKLLAEGKHPLQVDLTQAEIPAGLAQSVKLLADETKLTSAVAAAKAVRARAMKSLDETAALGAEIKKLKRENTALHSMVALVQAQVEAQVKTRKPPFVSERIDQAFGEVHEVIQKVFAL